jgi:hypothetical protein
MDNVRNNPGLASEASQILREYEVLQKREISLKRTKVVFRPLPTNIGKSTALLEWSQALSSCPSENSSINMKTGTENSSNHTDRRKLKNSKEN